MHFLSSLMSQLWFYLTCSHGVKSYPTDVEEDGNFFRALDE